MRDRKVKKIVLREPDLVLLEQDISHKNGFGLADQAGDVVETRKVPIVVLSAFFRSKPKTS